jgi:exopolysaccharide biosynthesis WecB/TagA/CpsF family protein
MQITSPAHFAMTHPVEAPRPVPVEPLSRVSLFDLPLVDATTDAAIAALLDSPHARARVHFLNAHCANVARRDPEYRAALASADFLLPDGVGIDLAARLAGERLRENLNGTDFTPALLRAAAARGLSVYLFGGTPGTADAAAETLCWRIPGLRIAGTRDGYAGALDDAAAVAAINASGGDIVLVAMGVPRQDTWIASQADRLHARLTLGVGALFDFLAGHVRRAPEAVRGLRLEWAWRLAQEPRRMAGRYIVGNLTFMAAAVRNAVSASDAGKRAMDATIAGAALVALLPLFAVVALLVKLDSRGPVLFRQDRVGRGGTLFPMLKFRSMHVDAEARLQEVLNTSDREGACFKSRNDPRITRVGRVMRRYSIDELPQILNVLLGQMSVVGPRPALPREVAAFPARAEQRLAVRPGITGLWQVSGRADIGLEKMLDMDIAYARARSLMLDVMIIAMTFRAVLSGRGAY